MVILLLSCIGSAKDNCLVPPHFPFLQINLSTNLRSKHSLEKESKHCTQRILIVSPCPSRYRVDQGAQAKGHDNGDYGISISSPRLVALSQQVNLSNESGNSAETTQQPKLYACCYCITSLCFNLKKKKSITFSRFQMILIRASNYA